MYNKPTCEICKHWVFFCECFVLKEKSYSWGNCNNKEVNYNYTPSHWTKECNEEKV